MADEKRVKKKQKLNISALVKVTGSALLIVLLILAAAFVIGEKTGGKSAFSENGFEIGAASVKELKPYNGGVAAVADSAVYYFDGSGNLLSKNEHTYSAPVACVNGKNLLLYDLGGNNLRIEKRGGIYSEHSFKSVITCGAIGKRGNYAYALNSDGGFQSHLFVFSDRDKKIFEWGSSSDYISCLSLSDNGKLCAASILTSENARIVSVVKLFDFSAEEPLFSVEFQDSVIYDISVVSSKQLIVFCDNGVYSVASDGAKTELLSYSSTEITHYYDFPSGLKAVSVAVFGNERNTKLTVFSRRGKILFEKSFNGEITAVSCSKNRIGVAFRYRIESYDSRGNSVGLLETEEACTEAIISGGRLYVLGANGLYSFSINSRTSSKTENNTTAENKTSSENETVSEINESEATTVLNEVG